MSATLSDMVTTHRKHASRERRAAAEQAILEAARTLLADRRVRDLSIDDLMTAAGLSRTAFYRYFPDLETLLQRLLDDARDELADAAAQWLADDRGGDPVSSLRESLEAVAAVWGRRGHVLRAVVDAAAGDAEIESVYTEFIQFFVDAVTARISADLAAGLIHGLDPRPTAEALICMNERYLAETVGRQAGADHRAQAETLLLIWQRTLYPQLGRKM